MMTAPFPVKQLTTRALRAEATHAAHADIFCVLAAAPDNTIHVLGPTNNPSGTIGTAVI